MADVPVASQPESDQVKQPRGGAAETAPVGDVSNASKLSGPALWVAIFALAVWAAFSVVMLFNVGTSETEWTRIAWVFGSIQSVAFAAAGALFGTAVQQQNINSAKDAEVAAKRDADQQRDMAGKGRALAAMVQADGISPTVDEASGLERLGAGRAGSAESAEAVRHRHAQVARSLFGDVSESH